MSVTDKFLGDNLPGRRHGVPVVESSIKVPPFINRAVLSMHCIICLGSSKQPFAPADASIVGVVPVCCSRGRRSRQRAAGAQATITAVRMNGQHTSKPRTLDFIQPPNIFIDQNIFY